MNINVWSKHGRLRLVVRESKGLFQQKGSELVRNDLVPRCTRKFDILNYTNIDWWLEVAWNGFVGTDCNRCARNKHLPKQRMRNSQYLRPQGPVVTTMTQVQVVLELGSFLLEYLLCYTGITFLAVGMHFYYIFNLEPFWTSSNGPLEQTLRYHLRRVR